MYAFWSRSYYYSEWLLPLFYALPCDKIFFTSDENTYKELQSNYQNVRLVQIKDNFDGFFDNNKVHCMVFSDEDIAYSNFIQGGLKRGLKKVCLGHAYNFADLTTYVNQDPDFPCIAYNKAMFNWMVKKGLNLERISCTGSPKHDVWFQKEWREKNNRQQFCKKYNLNPEKKNVLYAPHFIGSYNLHMEDVLMSLKNVDCNVIIKIHCYSAHFIKDINNTIINNKLINVFMIDTPSVLASLYNADVLISTNSSVMFEYLAFDRPIIGVGQDLTADETAVDRIKKDSTRTLSEVVNSYLFENNGFLSSERKHMKDMYFNLTDGKSTKRLLGVIENYVKN